MAPSDFYLFRDLKKNLRGKHFQYKEEVMEAVKDFFNSCSEDYYKNAFTALVHRWKKCKENNGSYIEK